MHLQIVDNQVTTHSVMCILKTGVILWWMQSFKFSLIPKVFLSISNKKVSMQNYQVDKNYVLLEKQYWHLNIYNV